LIDMTVTVQKQKFEYDPIARWRRDSKSSGSFNARYVILQRFLNFHNTTPKKLLLLASKTLPGKPQIAIEGKIERFLDYRAEQGNASSTVAKEAGIIISFLAANNVLVKIGKKYSIHTVYESRRVLEQPEVQRMIEVTPGLEEKAVICFLAQTAQRIGILTGLQWKMIHEQRIKGTNKVYGFAEVMPEIADRNGRPAGNKTQQHYLFGIHWQSMKLLDELKAKQKASERADDPFIFSINKRRMQEAITDAAELAGIQVETETRLPLEKRDKNGKIVKASKKRKWHEIHAHVFRRFWINQMDTAGVRNEKLLEYQLGHSIYAGGTYHAGIFTPDKIVAAIDQADKQLRVLPSA